MTDLAKHKRMANAVRLLAIDAVEKANSGHPGMPMGMADVATVLFSRFMKFDPKNPNWPDRDRFVLSAGHGSMLLYALLYLTGYDDVSLDQLKSFRQWGSRTPGHPEYGHTAGAETTTGPLGQGLATAVGMALAERLMNARYGDALVDRSRDREGAPQRPAVADRLSLGDRVWFARTSGLGEGPWCSAGCGGDRKDPRSIGLAASAVRDSGGCAGALARHRRPQPGCTACLARAGPACGRTRKVRL